MEDRRQGSQSMTAIVNPQNVSPRKTARELIAIWSSASVARACDFWQFSQKLFFVFFLFFFFVFFLCGGREKSGGTKIHSCLCVVVCPTAGQREEGPCTGARLAVKPCDVVTQFGVIGFGQSGPTEFK